MGRRLTAIGLILILVSILLFSCNSVESIQGEKDTEIKSAEENKQPIKQELTDTNSRSSIEHTEVSSTIDGTENQGDETFINDAENEGDNDIDAGQNNAPSTVESNESNNQEDNPQITNNTIDDKAITEEDFNIYYKGILINDKIPFEEIAEKLGIKIGDEGENTDIKAGVTVGNVDYFWYKLHYPSKEHEEIQIEYVVNETTSTAILVYVKLFNAKTYRGLAVGDDEDKLLDIYGGKIEPHYNTATTVYYTYRLEDNIMDKVMYIIVDNNSKKVTKISINYNQNKMMEELDIPAFD